MIKVFKIIALLIICICSVFVANYSKETLRTYNQANKDKMGDFPPLYLPEVKYVKLVSAGFNNFVSDVLWFNTVSYFGKQYEAKRDFKWLNHMCDLVTSLDPRATPTMEFCAVMLSWSAKEPEKSNFLLSRAITNQPDYWRWYYLRAFNYWYFLDDPEKARDDLVAASHLQDAPAFIASMASRFILSDQDPKIAVDFLKEQVSRTKDENARTALIDKLNLAYITLHIFQLNQDVQVFEQKFGYRPTDLNEMVSKKLLVAIPKDPFGGNYYIDEQTKEIKTSSGRAGLKLNAKTSKTGIAAQPNE